MIYYCDSTLDQEMAPALHLTALPPQLSSLLSVVVCPVRVCRFTAGDDLVIYKLFLSGGKVDFIFLQDVK